MAPLFTPLGTDDRPYITVGIHQRPVTALEDSGTNLSILGKQGLNLLPKLPFCRSNPFPLVVKTASQSLLDQVRLPISLNGITKNINILVVPSVKQYLILGIDFCKSFSLSLYFKNNFWHTDLCPLSSSSSPVSRSC